ncbi:hypothetical protein [Metabacillus sp. 84]|uniref:hypothetical protein n=1 Tax=Metabacillus sp. 84 TaxID=3404705 RepID=UPI003CF67756
MKKLNLTGRRFGRLIVLNLVGSKKGKSVWTCQCDCGKEITVTGVSLTIGETKSCGCLKRDLETENLRTQYDNKRVNGIVKPLFKGSEPRKDSSTGYRGVIKYQTRVSGEVRYKARLTVKGKIYSISGFKTPEEAYFNGRLALEKKHLPND